MAEFGELGYLFFFFFPPSIKLIGTSVYSRRVQTLPSLFYKSSVREGSDTIFLSLRACFVLCIFVICVYSYKVTQAILQHICNLVFSTLFDVTSDFCCCSNTTDFIPHKLELVLEVQMVQ